MAAKRARKEAVKETDPHLAGLEAALDRYHELSARAEQQLAELNARQDSIRAEKMPRNGVVESTLTLGAVVSLKEHFEALRLADFRFYEERDRRYSEVNVEREKALKIKETADLAALSLAREIQDYKDEKANNLRSQIEGERGHYATKDDLKAAVDKFETLVNPLVTWVSGQQGRGLGSRELFAWAVGIASIAYVALRIAQGH